MERSDESDSTLEAEDPFCRPIFAKDPEQRKFVASNVDGVAIEVPEFEALFDQILHVSPLARRTLQDDKTTTLDNKDSDGEMWSLIESDKDGIVNEISSIDNFNGAPCPLLRFRATLKGPACNANFFAGLLMDLDNRTKWDDQVDRVEELYSVQDLNAISCGTFGKCTRLGVGYYRSKAVSLLISAREQLTLCGIQEFENGVCIIWAKELESWNNDLLPPEDRVVRSKTHLFAVVMAPAANVNECEVEYILQLEVGGMIPTFLTTPLMVESVKRLFEYASSKAQESESLEDVDSEQESLNDEWVILN